MTKDYAYRIVQGYLAGWKAGDVKKITENLAQDSLMIESQGVLHRGIQEVEKWISEYFSKGFKIDKWEITSFYHAENSSAFDWSLDGNINEEKFHIEGASIVHFQNGKIVSIREYQAQPPR